MTQKQMIHDLKNQYLQQKLEEKKVLQKHIQLQRNVLMKEQKDIETI